MRAVIGTLVVLSGCVCTEIGCGDSFSWSATLPAAVGLADLRLRTCRNGDCRTAALVDAMPEPGSGVHLPLYAPVGADLSAGTRCVVWEDVPSGDHRIEIGWNVVDARDGDRYLVEITAPDGTVVAGFEERAVTYDASWPNGRDCPGTCWTARTTE